MSQTPSSLCDLEHHSAFVERHIGPNDAEIAQMLEVVGHASLDALTDAIVPGNIKSPAPLALPEAITEEEALVKIRAIADKNTVYRNFIGQGTTAPTRRRSSCATSWKTPPGTPPTRRTRRKSRKAAWRR